MELLQHFLVSFLLTTAPVDSATIEQAIKDSDLVVIGSVTNPFNDYYEVSVSEVFKGSPSNPPAIKDDNLAKSFIKDGNSYLLFAVYGDGNKIRLTSAPIHTDDISPSIRGILDKLVCYDESETISERQKRDPRLTGACPRNINPVCGCDWKTYENPCEAHKNGIMRYKFGDCSKHR